MRYRPSAYLASLAISALSLLPSWAEELSIIPVPADKAAFVLLVPTAESIIKVEGVAVPGDGTERLHFSPTLIKERKYEYTFEVAWSDGGARRTETKRVQLQPGDAYLVDFHSSPVSLETPVDRPSTVSPPAVSTPSPPRMPSRSLLRRSRH